MNETYANSGVNIEAATEATKLIGKLVRSTHKPEVLGEFGFFGGFYEFKGYTNPVLVSSVDGVGTKIKLAAAVEKYDSVGQDLVNHCINDIFTSGAAPLFFLDYIGTGHLVPEHIAEIVRGLAQACRENDCVLIGGETAEMPGVYGGKDFDLAGCIVGVVEKDKILNIRSIQPGDTIIGLPSSGLHTNGYSLVRKVFGESREALETVYPELGTTLGEALLVPHRCYYKSLKPLLPHIKGMAHITGGGLIDNVPRTLPEGITAQFDSSTWKTLPIFDLIRQKGNIDPMEMFHVFNMGIGMTVFCAPEDVHLFTEQIADAVVVGQCIKQEDDRRVIIT